MLTRVVVSKKSEAGFRRRALKAMPHEHIEMLVGYVQKDTAYICGFIPLPHSSPPKPDMVEYDADLMPEFAEGINNKIISLGTIHTHPDHKTTIFSDGDLEGLMEWDNDPDEEEHKCPDKIMAICAIETPSAENGLKKNRCRIGYWPTVYPLDLKYRK